jgi:hypothetical protein
MGGPVILPPPAATSGPVILSEPADPTSTPAQTAAAATEDEVPFVSAAPQTMTLRPKRRPGDR